MRVNFPNEPIFPLFLASPDALEAIWVSQWVIVSIDLTDVNLVSDDTYWRLDWCYLAIEEVMKVIKW